MADLRLLSALTWYTITQNYTSPSIVFGYEEGAAFTLAQGYRTESGRNGL